MNHVDSSSFFGLGLDDGHVPTCLASTVAYLWLCWSAVCDCGWTQVYRNPLELQNAAENPVKPFTSDVMLYSEIFYYVT